MDATESMEQAIISGVTHDTSEAKVTIEQVSKELWPFYGAMCLALLLVTYVPAISLWLPGLMK